MEKFWEWMVGKEYGFVFTDDLGDSHNIIKGGMGIIGPHNQILIGYMIEYLMENKVYIAKSVPWHWQNIMDIDGVYNWLVATIRNMEVEANYVQQKKD